MINLNNIKIYYTDLSDLLGFYFIQVTPHRTLHLVHQDHHQDHHQGHHRLQIDYSFYRPHSLFTLEASHVPASLQILYGVFSYHSFFNLEFILIHQHIFINPKIVHVPWGPNPFTYHLQEIVGTLSLPLGGVHTKYPLT